MTTPDQSATAESTMGSMETWVRDPRNVPGGHMSCGDSCKMISQSRTIDQRIATLEREREQMREALKEIEALARVRTNGWNFGEIAHNALAAAEAEQHEEEKA